MDINYNFGTQIINVQLKVLKVWSLPFWQPNIFQGEGAITSEVIAFTCIKDAEVQSIDLLFSILFETLMLLDKM